MQGFDCQRLENQKIQRALNDIGRFCQFPILPVGAKGEDGEFQSLRKGFPASTLAPRYQALVALHIASGHTTRLTSASREPILHAQAHTIVVDPRRCRRLARCRAVDGRRVDDAKADTDRWRTLLA